MKLIRTQGAAGRIGCYVTASEDHHLLDDNDHFHKAIGGVDFMPSNQYVEFAEGQLETEVVVHLPDSSLKDVNGQLPERCEPVVFMLILYGPEPQGTCMLSRKDHCVVEVGPRRKDWESIYLRRQSIEYFMYHSKPTWCD